MFASSDNDDEGVELEVGGSPLNGNSVGIKMGVGATGWNGVGVMVGLGGAYRTGAGSFETLWGGCCVGEEAQAAVKDVIIMIISIIG